MESIWDDPVNPAELAYSEFLALEETEVQREIVRYRELYAGQLEDTLIAELERSLLSGSAKKIGSALNYFGAVIDEVLDRCMVVNLTAEPPSHIMKANTGKAGVFLSQEGQNEPGHAEQQVTKPPNAPGLEWAIDWWQRTNMDELQSDLYEHILVDGEAFLILQPEAIAPGKFDVIPYVEKRYTSSVAGGDEQGCKMHYRDGKPYMASKRWVETYSIFDNRGEEKRKTRQFMTIFRAQKVDRETGEIVQGGEISHYEYSEAKDRRYQQWRPIKNIEWPYPMPIFHFTAPRNKSRGSNAAGPQYLLDNFNISLAVGAGITSLPVLVALGMYPTKDGEAPLPDGTNLWDITAGGVISAPTKGPETGSVDWLRPADLSTIINAIDQTINHLAITTGTPSLMSQKVRADAAAELIRRIEQRPIAVARQMQVKAGNVYTNMFDLLQRLLRDLYKETIPEGKVYTRWQTADTAVTAIASTEEQPIVTGYEMNAQERIAASK